MNGKQEATAIEDLSDAATLQKLGVSTVSASEIQRQIYESFLQEQSHQDQETIEDNTNAEAVSASVSNAGGPIANLNGTDGVESTAIEDADTDAKHIEKKMARSKETVAESKSRSFRDILAHSADVEKDNLISAGEVTPFYHMPGMEKSYQRIRHADTPKHMPGPSQSSNASISEPVMVITQSSAIVRPEAMDISSTIAVPAADAIDLTADEHVEDQESEQEEEEEQEEKQEEEAVEGKQLDGKSASVRMQKKVFTDDADDITFRARLRKAQAARQSAVTRAPEDSDVNDASDIVFDGGYSIPAYLWDQLFHYQKTGIKWLWELHCQNCGGIVADEMGLGKTVQVVAFLAGLHYTDQNSHDVQPHRQQLFHSALIVCPASIMAQWMREFHTWYPDFRVMILHEAGHHKASKEEMVAKIGLEGGILIATYETVRIYQKLLLSREWSYVVLDEGHKIRNPDAETSLVCKQFLTVHRLILTGAPIQNSLTELWSLFDFIFPGRLGTLPVFEEEFSLPIVRGGYTHATPAQVQLAYRCATILRDMINPYILRRTKSTVATHLPGMTEQVLFCNLTAAQYAAYTDFLKSDTVRLVLKGQATLFRAIHNLRKICNHVDLLRLRINPGKPTRERPPDLLDFGNPERSGKLLVVAEVLRLWKQQGHRALLFTQTRQMLDIIDDFLTAHSYTFLRIDGETSIARRLPLIDQFNQSPDIFVMILTTRAGGMGINLVGADRIILFDPDWNPSTDAQAKERAYRIGQTRNVTVYRLITRGTIEEKVYHRQIFKQLLTDKILKDPKQNRYFSQRDMRELLTLGGEKGTTETAGIFHDIDGEIVEADVITRDHQPEAPSRNRRQKKAKPGAKSRKQADPVEVKNDDDYILSVLFKEKGIHSAFSHDKLDQGLGNGDTSILAREARNIAQRAVEALKRSRQHMQGQSISTPTWTGRSGIAGAPPLPANSSHFQPFSRPPVDYRSSASLLAHIRQRQGAGAKPKPSATRAPVGNTGNSYEESIARDITTFLKDKPNGVESQRLIQHFAPRVRSERDKFTFRQILRSVAELKKTKAGSMWILKKEFA